MSGKTPGGAYDINYKRRENMGIFPKSGPPPRSLIWGNCPNLTLTDIQVTPKTHWHLKIPSDPQNLNPGCDVCQSWESVCAVNHRVSRRRLACWCPLMVGAPLIPRNQDPPDGASLLPSACESMLVPTVGRMTLDSCFVIFGPFGHIFGPLWGFWNLS